MGQPDTGGILGARVREQCHNMANQYFLTASFLFNSKHSKVSYRFKCNFLYQNVTSKFNEQLFAMHSYIENMSYHFQSTLRDDHDDFITTEKI